MGLKLALAVFVIVVATAIVVGIYIKNQSAEALFTRAEAALDKGQHDKAEKLCGKVMLKPQIDPELLAKAREMAAYCRVMLADSKIVKPWNDIIRLADGFLELYAQSVRCAEVKEAKQRAMLGKAQEHFAKVLKDAKLDEPAKVDIHQGLIAYLDEAIEVKPDGAEIEKINSLRSDAQKEVDRLKRLMAYRRARGHFRSRTDDLRKGGHYAQAHKDYMSFESEYPEAKDDAEVQTYVKEIAEEEYEAVAFHESAGPAGKPPPERSPSFEKQFWLVAHKPGSHGQAADAEGTVFCMAKGVLYAMDAATGAVRWVRPGSFAQGFLPVCAVRGEDRELVVVASNVENALLLLNASDGKEIWRQPLEHECVGPPRQLESRIYLTALGRGVLVYSLKTGALLGRYPMADGILAPPYLDGERKRLLVASENGQIYELELDSGKCKDIVRTGLPSFSMPCGPVGVSIYLVLNAQQDRGSAGLQVYAWPRWAQNYEPAKSPVEEVGAGIVGELHLRTPFLYAFYGDGCFRALRWNARDPKEGVVLNEEIFLASSDVGETNAQFTVVGQGGDRILLLAVRDSLKAYNLGTGTNPVPAEDDLRPADDRASVNYWRALWSPRVAFPLQRRGSVVYAAYEGIESDGTVLFAYDFQARQVIWRVALGMEPTDLVLQKDTGYVRTSDGSLFELDLAAREGSLGARLLSTGKGDFSPWVAPPLVRKADGESLFYLGGKNALAAVKRRDGRYRSLWPNDCVLHGFVAGPLAWLDRRLIVATDAGKVYAVSASTGARKCDEFVSGQPPSPFRCGPTIGPKGHVFIGAENGVLYKLRLEEKGGIICLRPAAQFDTKGELRARPTLGHGFGIGIVYVGNLAGHVWACSTRDLRELGHWQVQGRIHSEIAVWRRRLLIVSTDEGSVYALRKDAKDAIEWRFPKAGKKIGAVLGAPAVTYDTVYVGSSDGCIYGIKAATGEPAWQHKIGYPISRTPVLHNGRVIVATTSGQLFVVRPRRRRTWR